MNPSQNFINKQQKYNRLVGMNNAKNTRYQQNIYTNMYNNNKNYYLNNSGITNDGISATEANSMKYKNNYYEKPKDTETHIIIKSLDPFVTELFKAYNEDNCLCNYILFKKNIEINISIDNKKK